MVPSLSVRDRTRARKIPRCHRQRVKCPDIEVISHRLCNGLTRPFAVIGATFVCHTNPPAFNRLFTMVSSSVHMSFTVIT